MTNIEYIKDRIFNLYKTKSRWNFPTAFCFTKIRFSI